MPRFSVVVPAFNAEATLVETLDAVAAQGFRDWECLVVDDGSVDGTRAIAESFAADDSRFRVIHQGNRGSAGAYNTGVAAAVGEWVCICSADDVLLPAHLSAMSQAIDENPGYDILSCNGYYWFPDGRREAVYSDDGAGVMRSWSLEDVFAACFFSVGACYRRELFERVGGYPEGAYGEDYIFWMRAMAEGAQHLYVPQLLALHRISATQKSANLRRAYSSDIESITAILASGALAPGQATAARAAIAHRRRMLLELGPVGGPVVRMLRAMRDLFAGRGRR